MQVRTDQRIVSIDIIRGLIMVIMALDHVRDYFHITATSANPLDPGTTSGALYLTRWVTHFCAPSFMLLSGVSSFLSGQNKTQATASSFLIKRGSWLILVEATVMTFGFTFDMHFATIMLAVLWALGGSMIVLGVFVSFCHPKTILAIGLTIVFGHNLLDYVKLAENSPSHMLLKIFFTGAGTFIPRGDGGLFAFLYTIVPWAGVMMSGYGLGIFYRKGFPVTERKKILVVAGIISMVLFLALRIANGYGDPAPWTEQKDGFRTFLSFMNVSKYPPSLMFTLATLGPVLLALAFTEARNIPFAPFFTVYGRVPFFFFITHFYLAHLLCALVAAFQGYTFAQLTDAKLFFKFRPDDFGFELGVVYLVWMGVVLALYQPCKWFGNYRARERKWWLSYL